MKERKKRKERFLLSTECEVKAKLGKILGRSELCLRLLNNRKIVSL